MRLFAAIVPPLAVVEELVAAAYPAPGPSAERPAPGMLRRLSGRGAPVASAQVGADPGDAELSRHPLEQLYLPITGFGNVTLGDSVKLATALRVEARSWPRPDVAFAGGGAALEFPGDVSVWAKLSGDLDELAVIGRGVPEVVTRFGFFVDRRQWRPWLSVGTINERTGAPYLEALVARLDELRGRTWTVEAVSLMRRPPDATAPEDFEVMEQLPIGG